MKKYFLITLFTISLSLLSAKDGGLISIQPSYDYINLKTSNIEYHNNTLGLGISYNFFASNNWGFGAKINYGNTISHSLDNLKIKGTNVAIGSFDKLDFFDIALGVSLKQELSKFTIIENILPLMSFQSAVNKNYIDSVDLKTFYIGWGLDLGAKVLYNINSHFCIGLGIDANITFGLNSVYINYPDATKKTKFTEKTTNVFSVKLEPSLSFGYYF